MLYITNAFSLGMFKNIQTAHITIDTIYENSVKWWIEKYGNQFVSAVGHQATADFISKILGVEVPFNRIEIKLNENDDVIVFQLQERLPEGRVLTEEELKEFASKVKWYLVHIDLIR